MRESKVSVVGRGNGDRGRERDLCLGWMDGWGTHLRASSAILIRSMLTDD